MSMNVAPAVSVLLAVYNCERYVAQAVGSVLAQTFADLEVVIVDDGSKDGSLAILQELAAADARVRLVSRPNKGIVRTANEMFGLARGRFISLLDHDDVMRPECIEVGLAHLARHPECVAVGALSDTIDGNGRLTGRKRDLEIMTRAVSRRPARFDCFPPLAPTISNPGALIRADAMRDVGAYRDNMAFAHDTDFWFRLARRGEIHRLNRVLVDYRIHGTNTTVEQRTNVMLYDAVAYLSGCARAFGRDDEAIIGAFDGRTSYDATIGGYRRLISVAYPVDTFLLYKAVGTRIPAIAACGSLDELAQAARRHALSKPITSAKFKLLRRLFARRL